MREYLIEQVSKIMKQIDDTQDLVKIYTFAKTYLEMQQEEKQQNGILQSEAD